MADKDKGSFDFSELFEKMVHILSPERSFYITSIVYGLGVSILTLAIPISVQALVNTVTFGVLLQPLLVLSILLLALLVFSGTLQAIQTFVIEKFQMHFYGRITSVMSRRLIMADGQSLDKKNGQELANKYFDVMTVQKTFTTLLTDGLAIVLQLFVGMILLAFYHPYFIIFDLLLIALLFFTWKLYGQSAIQSAIYESKAKYKVANWLEEIARVNNVFKNKKVLDDGLKKSDEVITYYLDKRFKHFKYLFKQTIILLGTYALMSSLILGLGGFLVIKQQLSLGQLVAAELIVTVIMANFLKISKYLESFYDLIAASDKLYEFYDLKQINAEKSNCQFKNRKDVELKNVEVVTASGKQFHFNYNFKAGNKYFINASTHSVRSIFTDIISKQLEIDKGEVWIGGNPIGKYNVIDIRSNLQIVNRGFIINGTIEDNLKVYNHECDRSAINEVLTAVDLISLHDQFDEGLETELKINGAPLYTSQLIRLDLARSILANPDILIITETIDQIDIVRKKKVFELLKKLDMTIIVFSNRQINVEGFDEHLKMSATEIEHLDTKTASSKKEHQDD